MKVVDMGGGWSMLPPAPDKCQECAVEHTEKEPHYAHSLYYRTSFYLKNKRYPTWKDALAHCTEDVRKMWITELALKGVKVDE